MSLDILTTYNWTTNERGPVPGTDDWQEVALLGSQGGYDWADFNAFYSPSARRYFWHGDGGCSCSSWEEGISSAADFENGDRAALLRAWESFAKENPHYVYVTDYLEGVSTIKKFKEAK